MNVVICRGVPMDAQSLWLYAAFLVVVIVGTILLVKWSVKG